MCAQRLLCAIEDRAHSKSFQWVADPDKIIAVVRRGHQVLDSIHSVGAAASVR
jgi:hypothetical protein